MKPTSKGLNKSVQLNEPRPPTAIENPALRSQTTIGREPDPADAEDDDEIARMLGLAPEPHAISDVSALGLPRGLPPAIAPPTPAPPTHQGTASPPSQPTAANGPASSPKSQAVDRFRTPSPAASEGPKPVKSLEPETSARHLVRHPSKRGLRTPLILLSLMVLGGTSTYVIFKVTSPGKTTSVESPLDLGNLKSSSDLALPERPASPTVRNMPAPEPVNNVDTSQMLKPSEARVAELPRLGDARIDEAALPSLPSVVETVRAADAAAAELPEQAVVPLAAPPPEPTKPPPAPKNEPTPPPPQKLVERDITRYASASASSTLPADIGFHFVPRYLLDGRLETSWQASAKSREGVGESFTLRFARSHLISSLEIANGYQFDWKGQDLFSMNARLGIVSIDLGERTDRFSFGSGKRGYVRIPIEPPVKTSRITVRAITVHSGSRWPDLAVSDVRVIALIPAR